MAACELCEIEDGSAELCRLIMPDDQKNPMGSLQDCNHLTEEGESSRWVDVCPSVFLCRQCRDEAHKRLAG